MKKFEDSLSLLDPPSLCPRSHLYKGISYTSSTNSLNQSNQILRSEGNLLPVPDDLRPAFMKDASVTHSGVSDPFAASPNDGHSMKSVLDKNSYPVSTPDLPCNSPLARGEERNSYAPVSTDASTSYFDAKSGHTASTGYPDSTKCNGSLNHSNAPAVPTPHVLLRPGPDNLNGTADPPLSAPSLVKMDLVKLDDTIDHVLAAAVSDEPHEDMFFLNCRLREPIYLCSPTPRANTPSSGIVASASSSPASSPKYPVQSHATPLISSWPLQSVAAQNSVCNSRSSQLIGRPSLVQLTALPAQHIPVKSVTGQNLSFLHLHPGSVVSQSPITEHVRFCNSTQQPTDSQNPIIFQSSFVGTCNDFATNPSSIEMQHGSLTTDGSMPSVHSMPLHTQCAPVNPTQMAFGNSLPDSSSKVDRQLLISRSGTHQSAQVPHFTSLTPTLDKDLPSTNPPTADRMDKIYMSIAACGSFTPSGSRVPQASLFSPTHLAYAPDSVSLPGSCSASLDQMPVSPVRSRKRSNASSTGNAKRRKTSVKIPQTLVHCEVPHISPESLLKETPQVGELLERLKSDDLKSLVSAPFLVPFSHSLPPYGFVNPPSHLNPNSDCELLSTRALKYVRGVYDLPILRKSAWHSTTETDRYILQNISVSLPCNTVPRDLKTSELLGLDVQLSVPASPQPISFDRSMKSLLTSLRPFSDCTESNELYKDNISENSPACCAPKALLPVFYDSSYEQSEADSGRGTPPLPMHHMPNPRLICRPIHIPSKPHGKESSSDVHYSRRGFDCAGIPFETTGQFKLSPEDDHNPPDCYSKFSQFTDGCEQVNGKMDAELKTHHIHLPEASASIQDGEEATQNTLSELKEPFVEIGASTQTVTAHSSSSSNSVSSVTCPNGNFESLTLLTDIPRYSEDPTCITTLAAERMTMTCQMCGSDLNPQAYHRKSVDELTKVTGHSFRTDGFTEFVLCSEDCFTSLSQSLSGNLSTKPGNTQTTSTATLTFESSTTLTEARPHSIVCDLSSSTPILLQNRLNRGQNRRQSQPNCKRSNNDPIKYRRFDTHWKMYSSEHNTISSLNFPSPGKENGGRVTPYSPLSKSVADKRSCVLCHSKGDAQEEGAGRLLPLTADKWIHVNCCLWCFDAYETTGGAISDTEKSLKRALATSCTQCFQLGAALPCYNPRCTAVFHIPCAISACCLFTDRGMYCPLHHPKENHPVNLPTLAVNRRVFVARDESSEIGQAIQKGLSPHNIRIGSLCVHTIGQILPRQLECGRFHSQRHIYPVGFRSTRIYWSCRVPHRRSLYLCEITESDERPSFRVTAVDRGLVDESFVDSSCDAVWRTVLSRIEALRSEHKLIRLFAKHLTGECMFGLTEPQVIRAVESLPGVSFLRDYVFNFGKMEIIPDMPLAVNPTGCARSEPVLQTSFVRRDLEGGVCSALSVAPHSSFPGLRRSRQFSLANCDVPDFEVSSKRKFPLQQYKHLKAEVCNNVYLGRSRIQGLGLFAARTFEPQALVIEYVGELIRIEVANERERRYAAQNRGIYMFRLDDDIVIDATMCGGMARYINHSCQPNCIADSVDFGERSHIVIITNRRIERGEELCYDYNFSDEPGDKIPCLCRSLNCRKWLN